jgi:hypothetical protein
MVKIIDVSNPWVMNGNKQIQKVATGTDKEGPISEWFGTKPTLPLPGLSGL